MREPGSGDSGPVPRVPAARAVKSFVEELQLEIRQQHGGRDQTAGRPAEAGPGHAAARRGRAGHQHRDAGAGQLRGGDHQPRGAAQVQRGAARHLLVGAGQVQTLVEPGRHVGDVG